ncbi:N,N-dimethylformamidase beta subunit family domain-containing protein [Acidisphaera rubrifaciens]|uniref:Large subunit of N,N-dimethylformamidase n=1 Tax=Acidisphaera rubrifaciens HS-AP3 TaxID=1231350 RepID=A0A0D6P4X8_9PROT|nr:N,N-dimethylformamidase beta subunit family domain-containing protein [Acidisphaera rubrifaciens]GAN76396.1 large subunit of N,N-dimethylformamidase [Acidisphaera rubrifaciens HS-AP3]
MSRIKLEGYTDRLSVKPGETIRFMVSAEGTTQMGAQLVRLIHGDENPAGPGYMDRPIDAAINRTWPARRQYAQQGSFLRVDDGDGRLALDTSFTLHAFIYPTLPGRHRQTIMGRWAVDRVEGYALGLDADGRLEFRVAGGGAADQVTAETQVVANTWYFVAATWDAATRRASVRQHAIVNRYNGLLSRVVPYQYDSHVVESLRVVPAHAPAVPFLLAAAADRNPARPFFASQLYNGKIDRSGVHARILSDAELDALRTGGAPPAEGLLAYWDTTADYTDAGIGDRVSDTGPYRLHAHGVNRPVRAMTGWNWNGRNDCFRLAPSEYGGIEFNEDAVIDCQWEPDITWTVPDGLASGVYALKLTAGEGAGAAEEHLWFVIRSARPTAPVCFLLPTASYLAYANSQLGLDADIMQAIGAVTPTLQAVDVENYANNSEYGMSTYDHHASGSGVCYSSYRRPLYNMRPKYRFPGIGCPWQFAADLSVLGWLEQSGFAFEVITDEDLHREGIDALRPHNVVITGTHNEYYSERMLDATEDYLASGGRMTYLAGNGLYWCVAFRDDEPWVMEVRKLDAGSRAWQARPGEYYMATTGERGGLWRFRNRAPQKLVGVGFTSEGMDYSVPFRRLPDSYHRRAAWIFDGVEGEVIGDFGLGRGGAAGIEIDRYDLALGTPPHALILAMSEPFSDNYPLVQEDILYMHAGMGGTQHPLVRADMVFFTTPNDGAVFSASSIAWGQALPWNNYRNNVAQVMHNVIAAFARPGPLPGAAFDAEEKLWR